MTDDFPFTGLNGIGCKLTRIIQKRNNEVAPANRKIEIVQENIISAKPGIRSKNFNRVKINEAVGATVIPNFEIQNTFFCTVKNSGRSEVFVEKYSSPPKSGAIRNFKKDQMINAPQNHHHMKDKNVKNLCIGVQYYTGNYALHQYSSAKKTAFQYAGYNKPGNSTNLT